MNVIKKRYYALFFPNQGKNGMYYVEEDGGAYVFSKTLYSGTIRDSISEARGDAPPFSFGKGEVRAVELTADSRQQHSVLVSTRTPKNHWVARCARCGLGTNGSRSTLESAISNAKLQYEKYPICGTETYVDLGKASDVG